MTALTFWIVIGGALGWLASVALGADRTVTVLRNIVAGSAGAFLGSLVAGGGTSIAPDSSWLAFIATLAGSIALIAAVNLARQRAR